MYDKRKVVVIMPAYNAARTIVKTYLEVMATGIVDEVIIVDGNSSDETVKIAAGLPHVKLVKNLCGLCANQRTCYRQALQAGADIIIMVHPDYQYTPKLLRQLLPRSVAANIIVCWLFAS